MSTPPGGKAKAGRTITILSVSPIEEDHNSLEQILCHSQWPASLWQLSTSFDLELAAVALRQHNISIVICESHLPSGTWRDFLSHISTLNDPPLVIVTSRVADDRLWAEALNIGAFDVLAKPFDAEEVIRAVMLAWQHWQERHGLHSARTKQRKHDQKG